jgi:hypothetical protein
MRGVVRILRFVLISASVLVGAALVRGVTYSLTHAVGVVETVPQFAAR